MIQYICAKKRWKMVMIPTMGLSLSIANRSVLTRSANQRPHYFSLSMQVLSKKRVGCRESKLKEQSTPQQTLCQTSVSPLSSSLHVCANFQSKYWPAEHSKSSCSARERFQSSSKMSSSSNSSSSIFAGTRKTTAKTTRSFRSVMASSRLLNF